VNDDRAHDGGGEGDDGCDDEDGCVWYSIPLYANEDGDASSDGGACGCCCSGACSVTPSSKASYAGTPARADASGGV
jgi:hypothetical protein